MFIIQNGKITSDKTLDIGKLRIINLVFESYLAFADDDKFKLVLGDIQSENFAFANDGCLRFSYVDVSEIIKKENTDLSVKVTCNEAQILADSITITAYVQGGGSGEEIQGFIFNNSPKMATELKIIPSNLTKNITNFASMFASYSSLTSIPPLDTSNGTNFGSMFSSCSSLKSIPPLDTTNGTNFANMFYYCGQLDNVPSLDVSNGTNLKNMFLGCYFTNFGGLLNAKQSFSLTSSGLTHQSLLNILNGLYDLTGGTSQTLTLGGTNLAKLTDEEKAIAINKNWTLA